MKIDEEQVLLDEDVNNKKERLRRTRVKAKSDSKFFNGNNITINEFFISNKFKYFLIFLLGVLISFVGFYSFNNYLLIHEKKADGELTIGINNVYDSVVYIENYKNSKVSSSGTGFIYKKDNGKGYILTNYHVVGNADSIKVTLSDDTTVVANYLGGDEYLDVACLSIDGKYVKQVAEFGSSDEISLGATLFTVGSSVGKDYRGTITKGILSGKDRLVFVSVGTDMDDYVMNLIQTDAAMNPGNSGGPLCDSNGRVIGINSLKLVKDEVEGMGFAISILDIKNHLDTFEKGKKISRPYLGVAVFDVSNKNFLKRYNLYDKVDSSLDNGVVIQSIEDGGSAFKRLEKGDVVIRVNDVDVSNVAFFRYELFKYKVHDKITITVNRGGKIKNIDIVLKEKSDK